ncbi:ArsC family transcriptional regulator [Thioclava sp. SK-1]|uniref:arsenate-mycothiol transferase ArsC n=1 Tax=Thioclava sp. SK-1 TaxID=1889770 RepID=UPI000825659E|nr:low molecular weight phosphatase family protein [Thioclava sp. SK-1]OCX66684.1 ArsC family transcriptional regulator [Thioclava sp. SK-1]
MAAFPHSVLFCCDYNATRSPMAEGMMKRFYGRDVYVQSAGVKSDLEIDGFTIAVMHEIGIDMEQHRARSFDDMQEWGDDLSTFDLVVALSPASQRKVLDLTRVFHMDIEYWPIMDPTGMGEGREARLTAYRQTRDQIRDRLIGKFGQPIF